MPHRKYAAAALAILAFAAASPAFAQVGGGGDDLLVGGQTSWKPAAAQTGGGTVADDVIVDGRIITGENPASAAGGRGSFGIDDGGFRGGARASDSAKPAKGGDFFAYGQGFQGGVRVGAADTDGKLAAAGGSRHPGGASAGMGDGSVRGLSGNIGTGGFNAPKTGALNSLTGVGSVGQLAAPPGAPPAQASNNLKQLSLGAHNSSDQSGGGKGDGFADIVTGTSSGSPHVKSGAGPGGGTHVKVFDASRAAGPKPGGAAHVKVFGGSTNGAAGANNAAALKGQAIRKN